MPSVLTPSYLAHRAYLARLVEALRGAKSELWWLLEAVGADSIAEMTSKQAVHVMSLLQQERALRDKSPGL
jgi:hypothetical protein